MGRIVGWTVGIIVVIGILFRICVAMGACGYNVNFAITRDGKRIAGVAS